MLFKFSVLCTRKPVKNLLSGAHRGWTSAVSLPPGFGFAGGTPLGYFGDRFLQIMSHGP